MKVPREIVLKRKREIQSACDKFNVHRVEFNPNSYRLKKGDYVIVDLYPKSMKCFFHDIKEWGEVTNITQFIKFQFTMATPEYV